MEVKILEKPAMKLIGLSKNVTLYEARLPNGIGSLAALMGRIDQLAE